MKSKVIIVMFFIILLVTACSKDGKNASDTDSDITPTLSPTKSPDIEPTKSPDTDTEKKDIPIVPAEPFDEQGRVIAVFGTPIIDGTIDEIWSGAGVIIPNLISSQDVQATGKFKVMWDNNSLYTLFIVKDPILNKSSMNTYEQDSVEVFLDELNDKASSYQSDDVHYRVNYDNTPSTDAGDSNRFVTATSTLKDDNDNITGYVVETSLTWSTPPNNDTIMGFDLQINDADENGLRLGTINIFDETATAWSNPSSMGEIIFMGRKSEANSDTFTGVLNNYIKYVESIDLNIYVNGDDLGQAAIIAKETLNNPSSTQEEIDAAEDKLRELVAQLDDGSGFVKTERLTANEGLTDPFTFFNDDKITSISDWKKRADEIARLYEYYMYGVMPDTSDENVSYTLNGNEMTVTVEKNDNTVSFPVDFAIPNNVDMPEGGYPVLIAYLWLEQTQYANDRGYAVITLNTELIAADNYTRDGVFYELYPYGKNWTEQTGALMAWSWGVSKILDALESGAAAELNINPDYNIMTGVSRWGKAAAVTGAFDKRIKVTAPSCSGSGGMASFRYKSEGNTYDYSSIGITSPYEMTANEPLSSLQSSSERHWFNDNFMNFGSVNKLPFDQHLLASLCAEEGRYLFITGSYIYEDWTNPPGMWMTYLAAREVFEYLGLDDNIAIHIHKEGHMVTDEDMVYLLDYCDHNFYGKEIESNLSDLTKSLYLEEANYDPIYDKYIK